MIANPARPQKFELRMSAEQRQLLEEAAEANDMALNAWALDRLLSCATRDIEEARTVARADEAFEELDLLLELDEEELVHSEL